MINDYPPMIIYDEDKGVYYLALQQFDETEDLDMFADFIREQTVKTWTRGMRL
jgi:ferritin